MLEIWKIKDVGFNSNGLLVSNFGNVKKTSWGDRTITDNGNGIPLQRQQEIQQAFADICLSDGFHQEQYCHFEHDDPKLNHLTCLGFVFSGRNQGRLRELVDFINLPQNWAATDNTATAQVHESRAD